MKNVIFIDFEPLTLQRVNTFCIDKLIKRKIHVEVWNMSQYFNYNDMKFVDKIETKYLHSILNLQDLQNNIDRIGVSNSVFVIECPDNWVNRHFFKLLKKKNCYTIKIVLFYNAFVKINNLNKIVRITPRRFVLFIKYRTFYYLYALYKIIYHFRSYDLVMSTGSHPCDVSVNHPDFEQYKEALNRQEVKRKYAVFLDQYLTQHPDELHFWKQDLSALTKIYLDKMNAFFSALEEKWGIEIIIAAHPKSNYANDAFNGRDIIKYQTVSLVKDAQYVISQGSSSFCFPILFGKPFLLVSEYIYQQIDVGLINLQKIATICGKKIFNIDKDDTDHLEYPTPVNEKGREIYIYNNLTSKKSENKKNIDIFVDTFESVNQSPDR